MTTNIEWTDTTWNPVAGCSAISPGCKHCYAARMAARLAAMGGGTGARYAGLSKPAKAGPVWTGKIHLNETALDKPRRWKRPRRIFVNSMSDLFHKDIPRAFIDRVFDVMERADRHVYQVLTKRGDRLRDYVNRRYADGTAPDHIWLGVSVEDAARTGRIRHLRDSRAGVRFVSFEPLLGLVGDVDLSDIAWAIVGGESGPGARPMRPDWARRLRDISKRDGVAFFFKQWGGHNKKKAGRLLDGREWNQYPGQAPENSVSRETAP